MPFVCMHHPTQGYWSYMPLASIRQYRLSRQYTVPHPIHAVALSHSKQLNTPHRIMPCTTPHKHPSVDFQGLRSPARHPSSWLSSEYPLDFKRILHKRGKGTTTLRSVMRSRSGRCKIALACPSNQGTAAASPQPCAPYRTASSGSHICTTSLPAPFTYIVVA